MDDEKKSRELVASEEERKISRSMMVWINGCPLLPEIQSTAVSFEQFQADSTGEALIPGMALITDQGAYITHRYIYGGYQAEYPFSLFYRVHSGNSNDARLSADESLNEVGDWAKQNVPELGDGIRVVRIEATSRASLFGITESGDEDHQIPMRMIYEVI